MLTRTSTVLLDRASARLPSRLRIMAPGKGSIEVNLPEIGAVIGADETCDVVLTDPAVSNRHATIAPADGGFLVTDLGSTNGTWLDGLAVTKAVVPVGSTLRVGETYLQLIPAEEMVELPPSDAVSFGNLRGSSLAMRRVFTLLERAAVSDAVVLCLGESGTGKELTARAIHDHSPRRHKPFVVFDCGAASDSLIESELFGHKRGAFTGAHADRAGAFASADGGTLFLDEIGDLPISLQPKLLRLLERGEVTPLGGQRSERYNVRVVAATHRDLWTCVEQGTFRGDLYYRLAVVEVHLPALRQRRDDVPALCQAFLQALGRPEERLSGPNLERLMTYAWPGNVRELRNVITRAVALAAPGAPFDKLPIQLRPGSAPEAFGPIDASLPFNEAKERVISQFERAYLVDLLRRADNNMSQAARLAGLERKHLYKVLERAGLPRE